MLTPYVQHAEGPVRELLGRVLGEVATPSMGMDLLQFMGDEREELRAAAARAMSHAQSDLAFDVLNELARDPVWFVRLRAIVGLGGLNDPRAIPALMGGLVDANRLVRLRAAEALVQLKTQLAPIFEQVVETRDRYGLHAYLTALENANLRAKLEQELQISAEIREEARDRLRTVLQTGCLLPGDSAKTGSLSDKAALLQ
jgi:HEAT repeat protein